MFITSGVDTVVLHMPKCGGSSVRWSILSQYPEHKWSCEHASIEAMPEPYRSYRRIGFCRNPYTWYISKYYHAKRLSMHGRSTLPHVDLLSDGFDLSFAQTLPRLLDMQNFLDMNPVYIERLKKRLARLVMNKYLCRIALSYPNIQDITADDFKPTLYDYWYELVGLPSAHVYKIDSGNFADAVEHEFPGTVLTHMNKTNSPETSSQYTPEMAIALVEADSKYFRCHAYDTELPV